MALLGLIFSFLMPLMGFIFSIIGLSKAKQMNGEGRGMALAGLLISIAYVVITVVVMIIYFAFFFYIMRDPYSY